MALAMKDELRSKGIDSRVASPPREYTSILLGGVQDGADLYISERDFISARRILDAFLARGRTEPFDGDEKPAPKNHAKRVIIFSLLGFLLPVVFNFFATMNFIEMKRKKSPSKWDGLVLLILIAGWAMALVLVIEGFWWKS